uniref:BZIP domain-containing protein n=2 Tax=Kalmanozyma brasiliensis (strain GHG001) TaxID=1365824 RepID=V5EQI1_KALBG
MAASLPFGRRPSSTLAPDFPAGADPRLTAAHAYAPHHNQPYPLQASDLASNYQYTTARAAFDHSLAFDGASGSNVPSWFYNASQQPASQVNAQPALPYHLDSYAAPPHGSAAAPVNMAGPSVPSINAPAHHHHAASVPPTVDFPPKSAHIGSTDAAPFIVGPSGRIPAPMVAGAGLPMAASISPSPVDRRASDESMHMVASAGPSAQNIAHSTSGSAGVNGSVSPNSSASLSNSPPDIAISQPFHPYASTSVPPLAGMLVGEPISASMMESIDAWLAPAQSASHSVASSSAAASVTAKASTVSARKISPVESFAVSDASSSARASSGATFHPGSTISTSSTLDSVPFKTSTERRERNKASQRESRKRKQDRLETLETENAALRKALADTKKYSHALSNGAGIRGEDGAEVPPIQFTKFTGAFHLDLIETHLEDDSAEAEWKTMIGRRFPGRASQEEDGDDVVPRAGSSTSDSDEDDGTRDRRDSTGAGSVQSTAPVKAEAAATDKEVAESSQTASRKAAKKAMWEISLNQKRQKAAQNFPSMVAVPELVLYRVCRLYFSTLLPFTTKLKSGIINLRAAREAPGFIGEFDDMPRFPGDPAFGASELYLPKNLMPTEMQMRIGFHPIEIAVIPYPAMRDRLLTVLSAFSDLDELVREEEDAARFSEERINDGPKAPEQASPTDDVNAELTDADIRKRTALLADMSAWKPKDFAGAVVMPDRARVYSYGFLEKPRGSHRLRKPAQRWLDDFFYEIVRTLRVWSPAGDVFDGECFEFKESFFRKYPYMVDGEILKATNRWRRARGEDPIRL